MAAQWDMAFEAEIIEWRGPPPYLFTAVPDELVGEIRYAAREASYGWGMVPVAVNVGSTEFATALFPRGETYMVPIKVAVQRAEGISLGDRIAVMMQISRVIRR